MRNQSGQAVGGVPSHDQTVEIPLRACPGPWVVEVGSPAGGQSSLLDTGESLVLGSGNRADLRILDRAVSAVHCTIDATQEGLVVQDHGSTNGLFTGGARVKNAILPGEGGSFVIGRTTVVVRREGPDDAVDAGPSLPGIVGDCACMRRVVHDVQRYAPLQAPVLIQGESGTGKDLVARALHELGRSGRPLVTLNVGAIPDSLADAELFGHCRGAFTGAVGSRAGAFEQAHEGTLFLDEIAELSERIQVKLLRIVEDGAVRPVGGIQVAKVRVRVVSATWATLAERVADGRFRPDLYHRLSTIVIDLPPLRQRRSDIPALCRVLLGRMENELGPKRLTSAALARLVAYPWPGNVRELGSVLYRAAVKSRGSSIRSEHIELAPAGHERLRGIPLSSKAVLHLLQTHDGNVSAAARAASVPRTTFRAWLERARDEPAAR